MKKKHKKWMNEFLDNCAISNRSKHTIINYRADLIKFIRWFENTQKGNLNEANSQTIGLYKQYLAATRPKSTDTSKGKISKFIISTMLSMAGLFGLKKKQKAIASGTSEKFINIETLQKKLAVSSQRRHLSCIKNFYEYLKQANEDTNNLFPNNPVKPKLHAIKLKEKDVENTKLLTEEDWEAIINSVYKPKELLIIYLLYYGGLRLTELTDLKKTNFNKRNLEITFVRKGGYVHQLKPIKRNLIFNSLDTFLSLNPSNSEHIFLNPKGKKLSSRSMYTIIMKIIKRAMCPTAGITPHSFRKACATNLYLQTKDLLFVRDYLNHSDAKVTQTYIENSSFGKQGIDPSIYLDNEML